LFSEQICLSFRDYRLIILINFMIRNHTRLYLAVVVFSLSSVSLRAQNITTFAGTGTAGYSGNGGPSGAAQLSNPTGVVTFGFSNVFIADQGNHVVRKVNSSGIISTFAGNDTAGNTGNGRAATAARLNTPHGIAADALGNIYIADYASNVVRKVNTSGIISTIAGTGVAGYSGDGGAATAAKLYYPYGVAVDGMNNVYIADANNNVIRKVDPSGMISTFAGDGTGAGLGIGSGGYGGDGGDATAAKLNFPAGVAADVAGNVYIADAYNNVVRRVTASTGIITTVAGNSTGGYSGDGGAATGARLRFPAGVAVDGSNGNLYIADESNNAIRKVTAAGIITTIAGTGTAGGLGDGGAATAGQLNAPAGVTIDGSGFVYIADNGNNRVRIIGNTTGVGQAVSAPGVNIYPNPSAGSFTIDLPNRGNAVTVTVMDIAGRIVHTKTIADRSATVTFNHLKPGSYLVKLEDGNTVSTATVTVQ
jgi:trimeric autotransporter adhesin